MDLISTPSIEGFNQYPIIMGAPIPFLVRRARINESGKLNASKFQANRASMIVYSWCVMDRYAGSEAARRMPPWKMTEAEAASWAARAGVELEKIEGSEETLRAPSASG